MGTVVRTMTLLASEIQPGDKVIYCGETFVAHSVGMAEIGLVKVSVLGHIPQFIAPEREVEVERWETEKPYVVLTRRYFKNGNCRKGRHTFATRAEQQRFLSRTTSAVTFTN